MLNNYILLFKSWQLLIASKNTEVLIFKMAANIDLGKISVTLKFLC